MDLVNLARMDMPVANVQLQPLPAAYGAAGGLSGVGCFQAQS